MNKILKVQDIKGIKLTQLTFTCSKSTIETLEKMCEIFSKLTIKTPEIVLDSF